MALTVFTGASGSGKTETIFRNLVESSVRDPNKKHIIIAPEQATLQIEKRIIAMHPGHVLFNIDVLSFNRLAYRIFDACELQSPVIIDETGKSMLLRTVLRDSAADLTIYKKAADKNGFTGKLKTLVSELLMYGITPEMLRQGALGGNGAGDYLREKMADIALILEAFNRSHDEHNITSEELLPRALTYLSKSQIFAGAQVVFEGFSGFTPIQYEYIEEILKMAEGVTISLTIPVKEDAGGRVYDGELFAITKKTYQKLIDTAAKAGRKTETVTHGDEAGIARPPELSHLAGHIFRESEDKYYITGPGALRVYSCLNPAGELTLVTHEIHRLVREEGYRYRDFAVVSGNLAGHDHLIREAFNQARIPCYIDTKSDVMGHPLAVLSLAALEACEKSLSMETVMRYLKSGLVPVSPEEVDAIENYALASGIRSVNRWKADWDKLPHKWRGEIDFNHLNSIKHRALDALLEFKGAYGSARLAGKRVQALKALYESLEIKSRLEEMADAFLRSGDIIAEAEYRQIYDRVLHILDEYEKLMGREPVRKDEFRDVLKSGLEELKLGLLPATIDQVHVGDVRRSRRGYVKVLFFIDFNEGIVPAAQADGGILSDTDRAVMGRLGMELAPSALQNILDERFYIYELMAAPTGHLYILYSRMNQSNKPLKPSSYLQDVMTLYDNLKPLYQDGYTAGDAELGSEGLSALIEGLEQLQTVDAEHLEEHKRRMMQLVSSLRHHGYATEVDKIMCASMLSYSGSRLSPEAIVALYGDTYFGSVSRLEQQARCPYAHFLKYGLGLTDRDTHELGLSDMGDYSHKVFQTLFDEVRLRGLNPVTMTGDERKAVIDYSLQAAEEYVHAEDYRQGEGNGENMYLLERAERTASKVANVLLDMAAAEEEHPIVNEYEFKTGERDLGEGHKLVLNGKVDRYDTYSGDNPGVRVYDYKSSDKRLQERLINAGLQLQLMEYLKVVSEKEQTGNPDAAALGAYYVAVDDKLVPVVSTESDISDMLTAAYAPAGVGNKDKDPDRLRHLMEAADNQVLQQAADIMQGNISVQPYSRKESCKYCSYAQACGFDRNIPGYGYRDDKEDEDA